MYMRGCHPCSNSVVFPHSVGETPVVKFHGKNSTKNSEKGCEKGFKTGSNSKKNGNGRQEKKPCCEKTSRKKSSYSTEEIC